MEQVQETQSSQDGDPSNRYEIWELRSAIHSFLSERGVGRRCHVTVNRKGCWYELKGNVDSQWTRCIIFSLVPKVDGHRCIIDKLHVGTLESEVRV